MESRFKKQIITALIFLIIFSGFVLLLYFSFKQPPPEEIIVEKPERPQVLFSRFFLASGSNYDVLFRLKNPNINFGSSSLTYKIEFFGEQNNSIFEKEFETYIWPADERWVAIPSLTLSSLPKKMAITVLGAEWEKISDFIPPRISIFSGKYEEIKNNSVFAKASGRIRNGTNFSFRDIDIVAVPKDSSGNALSANFTKINQIGAGEEIPFELTWFRPFSGSVAKIDFESKTDIFQNELFISSFKKD